ncbi:sigma-54 dependent transcriptional regulator [Pseudoalteromonas sp. MM17-2]|uniref:sigma-54-dependent transcriptional regulator n=1 Tax=Pseudoalteromonas sp. MM17-2 TaxID=2917753 RepID=UPI001EF4DA7C|nr:sigma-54 dependent transcriptional regulator [Pseudoalteromonas sp. MM17-2]MCG7544852.1 sigma-54 dependent transcriptional regulator [Pseudoalteromonas sp. MM17-2]
MNNYVLVVEDDKGLREALIDTLTLSDIRCIAAKSGEEAIMMLKEHSVALVVSDVQMPGINGIELLKSIKLNYPDMPVLMMTAYATIDDAVEAMRLGAIDYMAKPFAPEVLLNLVSRYLPNETASQSGPVVADAKSLALLDLANKVADSDASVMVMGPSGSGKEVLARYIHDQSPRKEAPFIAINCAAIPENMLESTLFGYEKGAFTGAVNACPGKFEQAQNGTILLDEITEMDLGLQAKLLRVLQEREVERLGSRKTIELNVRVLATSNRDLKEAVRAGIFREDLYYRLNVFPLTWLPLNQRPGDIIPLAEHLLERHCQASKQATASLSADAKERLMAHTWPGNVRELDNVIQRALILKSGDEVHASAIYIEEFVTDDEVEFNAHQDMPSALNQHYDELPMASPQGVDQAHNFKDELKNKEHKIILDTLARFNGKRKDVADALGISPRTLRYKIAQMREQGIHLPA